MSTNDAAGAPGPRAAHAFADLLGPEAVQALPDRAGERVVVRPGSAEEVAGALRLAGELGLPVYPVGGPPGRRQIHGVALDLSRLNAIVELNVEDMLVVAQAGVPLRALAASAEAAGLSYPPAFLACRQVTVGGSLSRGGGPRGPRYGPGRDYALGLKAALAGGDLVSAGSRAIKNATGYNLTQLLVGARGALGVIVEATLRLVPMLASRRTFVVSFADAPAAAASALALARDRLPPAEAELLDRRALEVGCPAVASLLPERAGAALLVLLEGTGEPDLEWQASRLSEKLRADLGAQLRALDAAEAEAAWDARRELPTALGAARAKPAVVELGLPISAAPAFVGEARRLAGRLGADVALFGSVGAGALEVAVLDAEGGSAGVAGFCRELLTAASAVGGRLAGASGAGLTYADWLDLALPAPTAATLGQIKATLDPNGILRPADVDF